MSHQRVVPCPVRSIFVDRFTITNILRLISIGRNSTIIWHFDPIGRIAKWTFKVLRWGRVLQVDLLQVPYNLGHVRTEDGNSAFFNLRLSATSIRLKIMRELVDTNPLISWMSRKWPISKILIHFDALIERELDTECQRIGLVGWILRAQNRTDVNHGVLLIRRNQWFQYLKEHALTQNINLMAYRNVWRPPLGSSILVRAFRARNNRLPQVLNSILRRLLNRLNFLRSRDAVAKNDEAETTPTPKIAVRYWYRKLGFDSTERTEFFWLNNSELSPNRILLYNYESDEPLEIETSEQLETLGIKILGRGPGIPRWVPTHRMPLCYLRLIARLATGWLICLFRGRWISPYYFKALHDLSWDYAYWYDFYSANNVHMDVGALYTRVGQVLALDTLNGISLSYQCSIANILAPSTILNAGEDIHVIYAPAFERMWSAVESPVKSFVHTGFLHGSDVNGSRVIERITNVRKELESNGAKYVICFLDENSLESWTSLISHEQAAADYEFLLNWLLSDPTLGIVFKPKYPGTLFRRINRLSDLIAKAEQSGRCKFQISNYLLGDVYPAEAAAASDICIGKLGGTAPSEVRLAGIKTILIDVEGFGGHPFYTWTKGTIAFEDWDSLKNSVEQYRRNPDKFSEFGEWSPQLEQFDSFQDGLGGVRMGSYIAWLHEELTKGGSKESALETVAQRYTQKWGIGHITQAGENPSTMESSAR